MKQHWITITLYMQIMSEIHKLNKALNKPYDHDAGCRWAELMVVSDLAIKAADIVVYDRHQAGER